MVINTTIFFVVTISSLKPFENRSSINGKIGNKYLPCTPPNVAYIKLRPICKHYCKN